MSIPMYETIKVFDENGSPVFIYEFSESDGTTYLSHAKELDSKILSEAIDEYNRQWQHYYDIESSLSEQFDEQAITEDQYREWSDSAYKAIEWKHWAEMMMKKFGMRELFLTKSFSLNLRA